MTSRMRLTDKEPTFLPADSKAILVKVQQKAVASAASSPMWVLKYVFILFQLLACKENYFGAQKNDLSALIWLPGRFFAKKCVSVNAAKGAYLQEQDPPQPHSCLPPDLQAQLPPQAQPRSEEHTSELQSRPHLVCRLLL